MTTDILNLYKALEQAKAENERLLIDLTNALSRIAGLEKQTEWFANIGKLYSEIKAEAYKEFTYALMQIPDVTVYKHEIKNLLKEKVGEDNAN